MTITKRIDAITHIPSTHRGTILPAPRSVKVELTAACDFRCYFCATSQNLRKKGHMNLQLFRRIAKEMRRAGVQELGLFYLGESFLYKHLAEAVRYAKEDCGYPYVFLTANGHAATAEKIEAVMRAGLDSLKWSFNWVNQAHCVSVTGVDAFSKVVATIKEAKGIRDRVYDETGHACSLYASSIKYDGETQTRMESAVKEIEPYVNEHYWLPLYNQAGLATKALRNVNLNPTAGNMGRIGGLVDSLPCWALFTEGHVSWDGVLTGCCFSHIPDFDFGDLKELDFMDAWNSIHAQRLRAAHLERDVTGTPCESCAAYS